MPAGQQRSCRSCSRPGLQRFLDLGTMPPANALVSAAALDQPERRFPLEAFICPDCFLVQVPSTLSAADIFSHYSYHSSYSDTWLAQCAAYAESMIDRLGLGPSSFVLEVASNDGYLLRNFVARGVGCLGIEPAQNLAILANGNGIPTRADFFTAALARALAREGKQADLLVANNVMAHVPELNDFIAGIAIALKPDGLATLEFHHVLDLVRFAQFDTIYHEHYSYFSILSARTAIERHGLRIVDVEKLPSHGGSLRIHLRHAASVADPVAASVERLLDVEREAGLDKTATYRRLEADARRIRSELVGFLRERKATGKRIAGYGAAAKGATLLNYCGIATDTIDYVVDRNPYKQGKYMSGSHIPIVPPSELSAHPPDYLLILPWNLRAEIMESLASTADWRGQFVVASPKLEILP